MFDVLHMYICGQLRFKFQQCKAETKQQPLVKNTYLVGIPYFV